MGTALFVVAMILPLVTAAFVGRFVVRHLVRERRGRSLGELRWSRLIHESRSSGARNDQYNSDDYGAVMTFAESLRSQRWPYSDRGVASIVWMRNPDTGMIDLYVGVDEEHYGDGSGVSSLAAGIGARAEPLDHTPDFPDQAITVAYRSLATPSSAKDTVEKHGPVAGSLSNLWSSMRAGESAAVFFTIDMMRNSESARLAANLAEETIMRIGDSANFGANSDKARLMADQAVRVSIASANSTGSRAHSEATLNTAATSISTFGWKVNKADPASNHRKLSVALSLVSMIPTALLTIVGALPVTLAALPLGLSILMLAVSVIQPGLLASTWMESYIRKGEVVVPSFVWWSFRWRMHGIIRSNRKNASGDTRVANKVAPPSCRQVLTLHPAALYEVGSFPIRRTGDDVSGEGTQELGLPSSMVDVEDGIFLGMDGRRNVIMLDLQDIHHSLYTAGAPNSGKSNFLQVVYAGVVKACIDKTAGLSITPVWGETKGEGAYDAWMIARHHPNAVFVDVHNPASHYRLALEGPRLSDGASPDRITTNVVKLVSSFQAAWGDGIRSASREIMDHALRVSMLLTAEEIEYLELDEFVDADRPNIMDLTFFLLEGDSRINPSPRLLKMTETLDYSDDREAALGDSIGTLSRFLGKNNRGAAAERVSSVLNKVSDLRNASKMWAPDHRRDVYISQIPRLFAPVVINMGSFYNGQTGEFDQSIERAISQRLIRSFNYLLWDNIKSTCNGWQKMGNRIPLFFDEVADVAHNAEGDDVPNTLEEGTKEGRSRGCAYFLGGQSPSQMPRGVAHQVLGFRSKFWFNIHNSDDLKVAVTDLTSGARDGEEIISSQNIRHLGIGTAMGIITRSNSVTPPFTLHAARQDVWVDCLFRYRHDLGDAIAAYTEIMDQESRGRIEQGDGGPRALIGR